MLNDLPSWNLDDLYVSEKSEKLLSDISLINLNTEKFITQYKNKDLNTLKYEELSNSINLYENIFKLLGRILSHASLLFATNMNNSTLGQHYQKMRELYSEISSKLIFFELNLMNLKEKNINEIIKENKIPKWKPWLRKIFLRKPYQLSNELEQYIAEKGATGRGAWVRLFDESSADLRFNFREKQLTENEVLNLLSDKDATIRKDAGQSLSETLKENLRSRSLIFNTISKDKFIEDKKRGFKFPISSRNLDNDVENEVVEALAKSVTSKFGELSHRYYKIKAEWFEVEKLNWWDRNAPLPQKPEKIWKWHDAKNLVLDSFSELSPKFAEIAEMFFENNWIDAKLKNDKDSGAFAHPTVPDVHPYILMNFNGKPRDVMTLAHELGHGVHQFMAKDKGYFLSDTPLTLAETASVFGEMLVFNKLLSKTKNNEEKKFMIAQKVEDMLNTVVRQIAFHNFETAFHDARKVNELTPNEISDIWMKTQKESLGESINLDESYRPLWAYIPHFIHTPFYVYAYAFGDCLVNSLWQVWQNDRKNFIHNYEKLLKSGGTYHHKEALGNFGLDATKSEFWNNGLNTISTLIDELHND